MVKYPQTYPLIPKIPLGWSIKSKFWRILKCTFMHVKYVKYVNLHSLISVHSSMEQKFRLTELPAPTASCPVESDPGGTQICVRSNLTTPKFDFFQNFDQWGMCLCMFWWSNRLRFKNLSLIYEIMKICEKKIGTLSTGILSAATTLLQFWAKYAVLSRGN